MRLNHLRTGVREAPAPQDAQEVGEVPLSITELLAALLSSEPLDLYDVEQAFSSLADNFNCGTCVATATDYAVRAVHGEEVPMFIAASVREAMAAPLPEFNAAEDVYDEFSHVLPVIERCCRALEAGEVDRVAFAADVEELAILYYMADIRAMLAVCRYVDAALPSIRAHRKVPPLGADFRLEGIPVRKYTALGAALLKALEERE